MYIANSAGQIFTVYELLLRTSRLLCLRVQCLSFERTDGQADKPERIAHHTPSQSESATRAPASATGWGAWRPVVIPTEHGGWGFMLEPVLLGLLVAPSWAALLLGLCTVAAFLMRHPLKITRVDQRRGLSSERTQRARVVIAFLALVAGFCFVGALWLEGPAFLTPLAMAVPFGAVYLYYDLTKPGRTLQAELTGPPALAFVASSMAVMDGWPMLNALALWAALTLRAVPSVLYVRARIRLDRGRAPDIIWPIMAHVLALLAVGVLIWMELLPALAVVPFVALLARAIWFLSPRRPMVQVRTIGFMELGLGLFLVVTLAIGYAYDVDTRTVAGVSFLLTLRIFIQILQFNAVHPAQ